MTYEYWIGQYSIYSNIDKLVLKSSDFCLILNREYENRSVSLNNRNAFCYQTARFVDTLYS